MILSQIDIPATIFRNYIFLFQESLDYVKEDLEKGTYLSEISNDLIWKDNYMKTKVLIPVTIAVLKSLEPEKEKIDIKDTCLKIQQESNCSGKVVRYEKENQLILSNNSLIYSISPQKIDTFFKSLQTRYEEALNKESDYEFIEDCIEIVGDLMLSQVFQEGNKTLSKNL